MQYIGCKVHKQGLFDNRVLNFSDRLTIVYGKNGSGKSLLARGMIDAVWGRFSARKLLGDDAWNSLYLDLLFSISENGYFRISNASDKSYRIYYNQNNEEKLIYAESRGGLLDEGVRNPIDEKFEGKILQEFIKRVDADTVINSSFIPSSPDIAGDGTIDFTVLKKIILEDGTGFYNLFNNLNKSLERVRPGDGESPPEVVRLDDKKRELEKKIQIIDISGSRHDKLRREKNNVQQEIDELNGSLMSLNNQKEILNKIIENLNKVDVLKNEFESIKDEIQDEQQKIKSITVMKRELDAMFPQFSDMDINDSTNLDRLQELFNDIRNLNEQIDNFYFSRLLKKRKFKKIATALNAGAAAAVIFLLARSGSAPGKNLFIIAGILSCAVIATAVITLYLYLGRRDKELQKLEEKKKRFKERIKILMEKSRVELEDFKLTEIYELLLQYFEDYINYTERKKDLARIKSSLKEEEYMVRIQKKLDELKKEEEIIKNEINTSIDTLNIVDDIENETTKIEELIQNIDREAGIIKEKIETKERILQQIDVEFIQASGNSETTNALIEEKNGVDRILKKWRVNQNSLLFIMLTMAAAVERSEDKRLRTLLDGTLDKFNHLTGNQYITRIDESVLLQMISENKIPEDMTPPVMHALLISLKFSLSDFIIGENTSVPLLIDEPFQFMDDERCNRFRDLVSYISNRRQVIIFTHHSDKRNWGNFIEL